MGRKSGKAGYINDVMEDLTKGLDELFLDVTDQINAHIDSILQSSLSANSTQTFRVLDGSFNYSWGTYTGYLEPPTPHSDNGQVIRYSILQLFAASHLAQYIRGELFDKLGYTASAGIATTKLVAKLLSNIHKPALQSLQNPYLTTLEQQSWLDAFPIRKLPGFGSQITQTMQENIPLNSESETLSVGKIRQRSTLDDFISWFPNQGARLWNLIHCHDPSPVVNSPKYPAQLSIEDSFPEIRSAAQLSQPLTILSNSFVRKLDSELCPTGVYEQFPRTLKVSMRNAAVDAYSHRESKSMRMPVDLFDLLLSTEVRVEGIIQAVTRLAKAILRGWEAGWRVGIINICATDLVERAPSMRIQKFIGKKRELDWDIIRELPEDIRREVLLQYHVKDDVYDENEDEVDGLRSPERMRYMNEDDDMSDWDEAESGGKYPCDACGARIYFWMREAHQRYHNCTTIKYSRIGVER